MGLVRVPRVATYGGLIFASLSPEGESLEEQLGKARQYLDRWIGGVHLLGHRVRWRWDERLQKIVSVR